MDFKVTYLDGGLGAMSASDRNFDCSSDKNTDDRSLTKATNSSSATKSTKTRKTKAEKNATAHSLANALLNHTSSTGTNLSSTAFAAINSSISHPAHSNGFEHALNYTPTNGASVNNLTQSNRYNTASLSDYYSNTAAHPNAAYYNGYPGYNSQTNVTIINNNYNLNVTPNACLGASANMKYELPPTTTTSNNALTNENSSCSSLSSNSSFTSCPAIVKKKCTSSTANEDYDQFNHHHLINSHSAHAFHPSTTSSSHLTSNSQPSSATHLNHLNPNPLNINLNSLNSINNLNPNAMLLNAGNSFNQVANAANSVAANQFGGLNNNGFVYSPTQQSTQTNLSPVTADQLATNNSLLNSASHTQQLQSQLVGLSHGSSPLSLSSSTTPANTHLHDQSTQLSPLSTASNSNPLQQQPIEPMDIDNVSNSNLSVAAVAVAIQQHQSINHHLNNSINAELGSPHTTMSSNSANSPQSNSSSSVNTNLSSTTSPAALYPYHNVTNHTPHHFLHYSRLSSYYHPEYHHLYNYFEPKFKNTVGNNLIGNNLISNNNLFSNEHNLFINNPSTNVF